MPVRKHLRPLISVDEALDLHADTYLDLYARHINRLFVRTTAPFGLVRRYVRAQGINLWEADGTRFYDFFNGFGCLNLGHNHPRVVGALQQALERQLPMIHQLSPSRLEAALAANLAALLPPPLRVSHFSNSGSEAVEASMKLARAFTGRAHFLSTDRSYHGSTFGALSLTGIDSYQAPFAPLLPFVDRVPFGDIDPLEDRLKTQRYAAVYLEPIQGQGGINVPPPGYLRAVRQLCSRHGTLLVLDEVQTGMGRTGTLFAFEHESVVPDILVLSKSLGGGIVPLSACITTPRIWKRVYGSLDTFLLHESTFGGNSLACLAGLAALSAVVDERLCENCAVQGEYFMAELRRLQRKHAIISDVRGRGLMIGVTFALADHDLVDHAARALIGAISSKIVTTHLASRLLNDFHVIVSPSLTDEHLLRLFPPLTVSKEDIDYFIGAFDRFCGSIASHGDVLQDTARKFVSHFASRVGLT
jgi:putrescine aminotransferase